MSIYAKLPSYREAKAYMEELVRLAEERLLHPGQPQEPLPSPPWVNPGREVPSHPKSRLLTRDLYRKP